MLIGRLEPKVGAGASRRQAPMEVLDTSAGGIDLKLNLKSSNDSAEEVEERSGDWYQLIQGNQCTDYGQSCVRDGDCSLAAGRSAKRYECMY